MNHKEFIKFADGDLKKRVLEVGSTGNLTKNLQKNNFITVDMSEESLSRIKNKKIKGDCRNLPIKDNVFEVAIFSEVIEHIEKETVIKTLKELKRVAKKVYITTPNNSIFRKIRFRFDPNHVKNGNRIDFIAPGHVHEYSYFEIKEIIGKVKLVIEETGGL